MRNADVRASKVAIIADAILNRDVDGAGEVVDRLVGLDYGFLLMPTHEFAVASTPTTVEYLLDDAVDYRRFGYEVIVVSSTGLPQRGVWADLMTADLTRRGEPPFRELDLSEVAALT